MGTLQLILYVAGKSHRTELAIANLRSALDREVNGDYELTVNDVLENPELAEEHRILATPTLVKEQPLPARRIIGDFSDERKILFALDLGPQQGGHSHDH